MGKHSQYGVILDAGSSGTRLYVYKWKNPGHAKQGAHTLPELKLKESKKIHPGVSTFADDVASVGPDHLQSLIDTALKEVPSDKIASTPVFLMATAGVRFLPKQKQTDLLQGICSYLQKKTRFDLPDCKAHIQVISGETEGLYGWIAANYLLGGFDQPEENSHGKGHHTYGFLDMGGASAQISFAPNATEAEKHSNDLKLVRMRRLDGSSLEYKVFTTTWLGFGANKARDRFTQSLVDRYGEDVAEIPDPCLPTGLRTNVDGTPLDSSKLKSGQVLVGVGNFEECLKTTHSLLGKDKPCEDEPCLLNGQHVPAIDFDVNHFVGVSEYWHTTHGVFGTNHNAYDFSTYQRTVLDFCSRDWSSIESDLTRRKNKNLAQKAEDARQACFKASWLINVLYEGIGIPRIGLERVPGAAINTTKEVVEQAQGKGFLDPFKPVDKIDGMEVSWTLGKMVLYAAGQIPSKDSSLPVGFGSNVASGIPNDFEHAGSSPSSVEDGDDEDWDDTLSASSKSTWSLVGIVFLLVIIGYLLRSSDRRRRLSSIISRRRKTGPSRKPVRGFSFARKLFGRNTGTYERVMEEGDAADFELGDMDSEDNETSDSSDGSRSGRVQTVPRVNVAKFEELQLPSAMDRNGMVVRTESRERLAPTVQMLNAGRRSRAGSPTRMKSPLMTPLQED